MKHTHHHFLITLGIAVTLLTVSVYFYLNYSIRNMADAIVSTKGEVIDLETKNTKDAELKKLYSNSQGDWEKLYAAFVPSDNVVPFIEALEALGPKVGGDVSVTTIDNTKPGSDRLAVNGYIDAGVVAHGSWMAVMKVLKLAENLQYKTSVSNVKMDLSADATKKSPPQWTVSFDVIAVKSI